MSEIQPYNELVNPICALLAQGREQAGRAVNTILLQTYWRIGRHIVEFEQKGNEKAEYGSFLFEQLAKDLTKHHGKGFSRSNLLYMRKIYLTFPKSETLSNVLSWSHYFEILRSDNELEISFYLKQAEKDNWSVRELKRQMKSMLFHRLSNSKDKESVLSLAKEGAIAQCAYKDQVLVEYATDNITNQLFVSKYQLYLPDKKQLQYELEKLLEG
jgi:hypothetical protein